MKGILILLMVLGHTYVFYKNLIYLFHIPVFFMISGYCWNDRHANDLASVKNYFLQKIKRLYIPFVCINVSYILLNNLFIKLGIYTDSALFLEIVGDTPVKQALSHSYSFSEMLKAIARTLLFAGGAARLCGATWFLTTLFMVTIFHCVFVWIIRSIRVNSIYSTLFILLVSLMLSWAVGEKKISLIGSINRFPAAYSAYLLGILIRKGSDQFRAQRISNFEFSAPINIAAVVLSLSVLLILNKKGIHIELAYAEVPNPMLYFLCMVLGWFFVKNASVLISNTEIIDRTLLYLGRRTIPILLLHSLAFKIISLLYIAFTGSDIVLLASYQVIFSTPQWVRYIYLLIGIVVPLLLNWPYTVLKNNIALRCDQRKKIVAK